MKESTRGTFFQGLIAGLIGYVTVAGFFMVLNLLLGRSMLFTASTLGAPLVGGEGGVIDPGAVVAFNGVHMLASMSIGVAAAWMVHETELHPRAWFAFFFLFIAGFIFTSVAAGVLAAEVSQAAPWWAVVLSNLMAASLAGGFLLSRRPWLAATVRDVAEN